MFTQSLKTVSLHLCTSEWDREQHSLGGAELQVCLLQSCVSPCKYVDVQTASSQTKLSGAGGICSGGGGMDGETRVVVGKGGSGWQWVGQVVAGAPNRAFGKVKMLPGTWQFLVNVCLMCFVSWSLFFHYTGSSLSSPTLQDDSFQKQFRLPTLLCAHPVHLGPHPSLLEPSTHLSPPAHQKG